MGSEATEKMEIGRHYDGMAERYECEVNMKMQGIRTGKLDKYGSIA